MKNNIKHFFLGMIIAAVPVSLWVISSIKPLDSTVASKNNLTSINVDNIFIKDVSMVGMNTEDINKPEPIQIPTATPTPTKKIVKTESIQIKKAEPTPNPKTIQPTTETPTPTLTTPQPQTTEPAQTNHHALIDKYANEYGANAEVMKKIAECESGFNPKAISPNGAYYGMYQFVASTWVSNRKVMGIDPDPNLRLNAEEAIKTAAFKMGKDGYGAWPACSRLAFKN